MIKQTKKMKGLAATPAAVLLKPLLNVQPPK
ncbi:MAG: hypothetical protein ACJAUP_002738 [Cellvibrionaceae bacterium]|jgi:hypothetical protein